MQSNSGDESLPDLDSTSCGYTSDVAAEYSNFYKGLGELKKWSDLPEILEKDNKKVVPVDGKGLCLMEAISTSLSLEYDILIEPDKLIELISKEVCTHPEYTKYLKVPLSQDELNYNLMAFHSTKKYSRVVADVYLPAISSALDLHIRTIQNISGFFGVVNTYPLDNFNNKKTVTLIVIDDIYQPVVAKQVDAELAPAPAIPALQSEYPVIVISDCESEVVVEYSQEVDQSPVFGVQVIVPDSESESEQDVKPSPDLLASVNNLQRRIQKQEQDAVLPHIPDIPDVKPQYMDKPESKKLSFSMEEYKDMVPTVVAEIPYDIDGTRWYMIDVPEEDAFFAKYRDGRFFQLHTSRRKGFNGVRRLGKCRGNFVCDNTSCPYFTENGSKNQHQFTTIGSKKFCYSCKSLAFRTPCPATKLVEFYHNERLLHVYHKGNHTCQLKPKTTENDSFIEENIRKFGANVGPKRLAQLKMTEEMQKQLRDGEMDMDKIIDIGARLTDKTRIQNIRKRMEREMRSERHSISAVAELKAITDTSDKYLIYKIHDENMTGQGKSYVFKSSRKMANLMRNMDQNNEVNSPIMQEPCYFDGMHKRCQGWKTLTLWVFHPSSRRLMRLCTMEIKGETADSIAIFWTTLNEMLTEVAGRETFFNPWMFITDEAGANHNGILRVFGQAGVRKSRTCQFHFKQSLQRMLVKFPATLNELKSEFEEMMLQLLTVSTISEFQELQSRLIQISSLVPCIESGLKWWLARRYNIFPVFRGYCLASVNMAEIGHSTLKRVKPLALVDAAWDDVCSMVMQEQEHTKFLEGRSYSFGKGPSVADVAEKEKKAQRKRSRTYQEAFKENLLQTCDEDPLFLPNKRARHREPETAVHGVEGNPLQPIQPSGSANAATQPTASQPKKFGSQDNPPLLAFLQGFKITTCFGCKNKFAASQKNPPDDLIIKLQVKRDRLINNNWVPGWKTSWGYFHLSLNCIKLVKSYLEVEDIYIPNNIRENLTADHVQKLQKMGWWEKMQMRYW